MASGRTLHSGNLVRGICAGDRKLFILLKDGVHKIDGRKKNESVGRLGDFRSKISYKRRSSLVRGTFYRFYLVRYERGS
jgi:hypothetical protein